MTDKPTITIDLLSAQGSGLRRGEHDNDDLIDIDEDDENLDVIELLRQRLGIEDEISDVTIASSLAAIAAKGDNRARWLAAFSSPLGKWLAMRGTDLNTALNTVLLLAPKPLS